MPKDRDKPKRPRVLADHKRLGKRFVPPFIAHLGPLQEVHWRTEIVPELVWLALLNDAHGLHRGAELARQVALAARGAYAPSGEKLFAATSSFYCLDRTQRMGVLAALRASSVLAEIRDALFPFQQFYPDCPLNFLVDPPPAAPAGDAMQRFKATLDSMFDRASKPATFAQANAIYIAFASDMLKVARGLALANFPAIETYPNDDESRRVASAVRAAINGFVLREPSDDSTRWRMYFWKRGLVLEPCRILGQ